MPEVEERPDQAHAARAPERMSRVDTAWLRMDNDVNLMMIVGVWLLTPAITLAALRERIADKLLKYDRFRQKAVADTMGARWVPDDDFDIAHHVGETGARVRNVAAAGLFVQRVDLQKCHVVGLVGQAFGRGDGSVELGFQVGHGATPISENGH